MNLQNTSEMRPFEVKQSSAARECIVLQAYSYILIEIKFVARTRLLSLSFSTQVPKIPDLAEINS
jgi:hypothetical protein